VSNLQEKIEHIDSKIKCLVDKKNKFLQKKKNSVLKEIEKLSLLEWDSKTLYNALLYLKKQKNEKTDLYQSWGQEK